VDNRACAAGNAAACGQLGLDRRAGRRPVL